MKRLLHILSIVMFCVLCIGFGTLVGQITSDISAQVPCCGNVVAQVGAIQPVKAVKVKHGRGYKLPPLQVRHRRHRVSEHKYGHHFRSLPIATQAAYDARSTGCIPPVGDQKDCGDCFNWSGCKACSAAQMVAGIVPKNSKFLISPQFINDCHGDLGGCNGGDEYQVAQAILSGGAPSADQYGGDGATDGQQCKSTSGMTLYTVSNIMYCSSNADGVANTQDIKNCILAYGYVSVAAAAGNDWDSAGPGTTITGNNQDVNHAIGLVGWDDNHDNGDGTKGAWIMQNNWSETWADKGYAYIKYGADSIGTEAFVAIATPVTPPPPQPTPPQPTPPSPVPPGPVTPIVVQTPHGDNIAFPQGSKIISGSSSNTVLPQLQTIEGQLQDIIKQLNPASK